MTISKKSMKWIPWILILPVILIRGFTTLYPIGATLKNSLFDIKVLPKTMTPGFESWWRVGVAEVSKSETVAAAYADMQANIAKTFDY